MATLNDLLKAAKLDRSSAKWVKSLRKTYENMDDPVGEIAGKNPTDLIKEHGIPQTAFAAAHGLVAIAKTMTQAEKEIPVSQEEKGVLTDLGLSTPDLLLLLAGRGDFVKLIDPSKLLRSYRPEEPDHIVTRILLAQFGDEPVIAFIPGTTEVATKEVAAYWKERRRTGRRREFLMINGNPARLYPVGVVPHRLIPENPLYPGRILWGEELECDVTGRPYVDIPLKKRQLMRVALSTAEITIASPDDAQDVIDRFEEKDMGALRRRYPKASMKSDDLDARNELPPLMVEVGLETTGSGSTDDYRERLHPARRTDRINDLRF